MKDSTLFLLFGSLGLLFFGLIGYEIYTTIGLTSYKLRNTIQEHTRMNESRIAHFHNGHNHNDGEYIH